MFVPPLLSVSLKVATGEVAPHKLPTSTCALTPSASMGGSEAAG